jgi:type I site-specific restriction-modification system R (restriction) subunit
MVSGHESDHEQATIERLQLLGYDYLPGPDLVRDDKAVILTDILKSSLAYRYPNLDDQALDLAVEKLTHSNIERDDSCRFRCRTQILEG